MLDTTDPPDDALLALMEELVASIELRDASDPDAPASEAERRIAFLEGELARRVAAAGHAMARPGEGALAGRAQGIA